MRRENEEDRIFYDDVDEELCAIEPYGDVENGKLIGRIAITDLMSTSEYAPVYCFNVESLIDDFIDSYSPLNDSDESLEKANQIISDLRRLADKIESKLKHI